MLEPDSDTIRTHKALAAPEWPLRPVARFAAADPEVRHSAMIVDDIVEQFLPLPAAFEPGPNDVDSAGNECTPRYGSAPG